MDANIFFFKRQNKQNVQSIILTCAIQGHLIHSVLCNHHLCQISDLFYHAKKKPSTPLRSPSHASLPSSPWETLICFLSLWICLLWTLSINGIIQYAVFCVCLLSLSVMFSGFIRVVAVSVLHASVWLENFPLYGETTACSAFIVDGHLSYSHFGDVMNNAAPNSRPIPVWVDNPCLCFSSLESITRNAISGSYKSSLFHWLQNQSSDSKVAAASFTIVPAGASGQISPHLHQHLLWGCWLVRERLRRRDLEEASGEQLGREEDKAGEGT